MWSLTLVFYFCLVVAMASAPVIALSIFQRVVLPETELPYVLSDPGLALAMDTCRVCLGVAAVLWFLIPLLQPTEGQKED